MADPKTVQKFPAVISMEPGTYYWCACGLSSKQPFCDGSHKATEFTPLAVDITEEKKVAWCQCKKSNNKPFCDGYHKKI